MRQALERRLGIVFGSGAVILFLIGALQNRSAIKLAGALRAEAQGDEIAENLARLDSLVSDATLGADGYALTGDAAHLQSYRDAAAQVPGILQKLQQPTGRNPEPSQEWTVLASETSATLIALHNVAEARTTEAHCSGTGLLAGLQGVDGARKAIRTAQEKERGLLQQQSRAVTFNSRLAALSNALGAALALWLLIVASLVIHRYVAERRSSQGTRVLATEVLRSLDQAVYLADETGMVLYANRAAGALFGYEPGKLLGMDLASLNDLSKPEGGQSLISQIHARLATKDSWSGILTSYKRNRVSFLSSAKISALELSGKSYWLFVQHGFAKRDHCDDQSEADRKPSLAGAASR